MEILLNSYPITGPVSFAGRDVVAFLGKPKNFELCMVASGYK